MSGSGSNPGGGRRSGEPPREHEISRRAYEKWEREGRPHGRDKDHWQEAERELAGETGRDPAPGDPQRAERRGDGAKRQTPPGLSPGAPAAATATGGTTAAASSAAKKPTRAAGSRAPRSRKPS